MQNVFAKLFIGATITAIGAFGADNSLGNWKLNLEEIGVQSRTADGQESLGSTANIWRRSQNDQYRRTR